MRFLGNYKRELLKASCTELDTGLPNSYGFQRELDRIIEAGHITDYCGFYFDIVLMGQINRMYGKACGDEIIKNYARILRHILEKDEILGRLSGDFFVALVKKERMDLFLSLLRDVPVEFMFEGQQRITHVSAVAGIYVINTGEITSGEILGKTTTAASYAKNVVRKPYVILNSELELQIRNNQQIEMDIRNGLKKQEFIPYYQPKVDSRSNTLVGAEVLARWKQGDQLISPARFIPVMERSDLICELDYCMLEAACRDLSDWLGQGKRGIPVSVNFSRKNLADPAMAERIRTIVERYELPPELIQIEITETVSENTTENISHLVDTLNSLGISTAIDDFGSGSSSITLLKDARFQVLKIDKSFVNYHGPREKQLLQDIIRMAKNMDMQVVAEGVELPSQIRELNDMDCYVIQGFVYGRPADREQFETDWLDDRKAAGGEGGND